MKIETKLAYMKIVEKNFDPSFEIFIPTVDLTYLFERDKPKKLEDAEGEWIPISEFGKDGWELINIIPKNLYLIGVFKRVESVEVIPSTLSHTCSTHPIITILDVKKEPSISIIDLDIITVNKPLPITDVEPEFLTIELINETEVEETKSFPPCIIDNTNAPFCGICGSSIKRKWFKSTGKCISPGCPNYWNKK